MSAGQQMPPWLQEQIGKMQQSQQNLQSILMQKQQVEMENAESDRALEELKKASDGDQVFKYAGSILIKSCLLYTSPSPRDLSTSRMPSSA